jgi:hypothetical protein
VSHAWRVERCRSRDCKAEIIWAKTAAGGKFMPVDAAEAEDGLVELVASSHPADKAPVAIVHSATDPPMMVTGTRHHSHFATCPDAPAFRKGQA